MEERKSNIVLIGMPGSGKSTVGVILAKRLGYSFVDADLVIQEKEGKLLKEIIEERGEEGFLEVEERINAELDLTRTVIAPGGSVIYGEKAMEHLRSIGTVVYLKISGEDLAVRLGNLKDRGVVLRDGMTLENLMEERAPYYERYADVTLDETGMSAGEVVDRLRAYFERRQAKGGVPCGSIEDRIGRTPMAELERMEELHGTGARLFAKLEYMNPFGSTEDRNAKKILDEAERLGLIRRGETTIVAAGAGDLPAALTALGARRGYRTVIAMPDSAGEERKRLLRAHGAELVLTDGALGMAGAAEAAAELAEKDDGMWNADAWGRSVGEKVHYETTGPEIWEDMGGQVDLLVCAADGSGAAEGAGRYLKERNPEIRIITAAPAGDSAFPERNGGPDASAEGSGAKAGGTSAGDFRPGRIPEEERKVREEQCCLMSRDLAAREGILAGFLSGAVLEAAVEEAMRPEAAGKRIVALLPDGGERFLFTELFG